MQKIKKKKKSNRFDFNSKSNSVFICKKHHIESTRKKIYTI